MPPFASWKQLASSLSGRASPPAPKPTRSINEYIPKELTESIERTHLGLKGPVTTPIGGGFSSINVALRKQFELFANFRPILNLPGVPTRYPGVDLIIVRENTEGLYSGIEHEVVPGVVESLKIITEKASTRISRFAFDYARTHKRKKIHAIHKANIMKLSDGLFIRCSRNISKEYPGDHLRRAHRRQHLHAAGDESLPVRHAAAGESLRRHHLRSLLGVCRRTGLVPGANFGHECAIFEAVHGSAPDIAGKDMANPTAVLRSAILMLRHLGEERPQTTSRPPWNMSIPRRSTSRAMWAARPAPANLPTQ